MFRLAKKEDLKKILHIYNQVIESRIVTADLEEVTEADRIEWFNNHLNSSKYPIWVYEETNNILAWCSYSQFYTRKAYDITSEISFYVDKSAHNRGLGKRCVEWLISQKESYGIDTLLAFVFSNNEPSISLLKKYNFDIYGVLPEIADMQVRKETLVILGKK